MTAAARRLVVAMSSIERSNPGSPAPVDVRHPPPVPERTAFRSLGRCYLVLIHFKNKQSNGRRQIALFAIDVDSLNQSQQGHLMPVSDLAQRLPRKHPQGSRLFDGRLW